MADYLELSCRLPLELEERLAEVLGAVPVLGAQVLDIDDREMSLTVYIEGSRYGDVERLRTTLEGRGARDVVVGDVEDRDWLTGWRESAVAFEVGQRWWIDPHPDSPTIVPDGRIRLVVEPRTAFGSGTHESTRLVLAELEERFVAGADVLDIGTGSGILAIAAERLGARTVVAFDIDPEAVWVARRTAAEQDWPARPLLFAGPVEAVGDRRFDIILCNMITEQLQPLLPAVRRALAPTGVAVLSGALSSELERLRARIVAEGFSVMSQRQLGEWSSISVARDGD